LCKNVGEINSFYQVMDVFIKTDTSQLNIDNSHQYFYTR